VGDALAKGDEAEHLGGAPLETLFHIMRSGTAEEVELAWGECYKRYHEKVWRRVYYVIRTIPWLKEPGEVAIDVTSEVFARLSHTVGQYREVGKPEAWLMQVAIRTALRQKESITGAWSKTTRGRTCVDFNESAVQDIAAAVDSEDVEAHMELTRRMEEWTRDADKTRWVAFVKLFLEGYGHDEIAERLGITAGTSRTLLWKVRLDLGRTRSPGGQ